MKTEDKFTGLQDSEMQAAGLQKPERKHWPVRIPKFSLCGMQPKLFLDLQPCWPMSTLKDYKEDTKKIPTSIEEQTGEETPSGGVVVVERLWADPAQNHSSAGDEPVVRSIQKRKSKPEKEAHDTTHPSSHSTNETKPSIKFNIEASKRRKLTVSSWPRDDVDESQEELTVTPQRVSLKDPLSSRRILWPVKGKECDHLGCFDLLSFVRVNMGCEKWECPVCGRRLRAGENDLIEDGFFKTLLQTYPEDEAVWVNADGRHSVDGPDM
ncbi:hypothetical protein HDV00_005353 [Rhizophlyctis rosea]|nr:hypothetical protein HDV00_005353 [Rhizophlyctis rosea]